jgi:TonB family protein
VAKRKSTGTCLLILALELVTSLAVAQESSKARSKLPVRQRISNVSAFDDQAESFRPHFTGNDAEAIYELVKAKLPNPAKSEFESNSEYDARVHEFANKTLVDSTKVRDLFAFSLSGSPFTEPVSADLEKITRNVEREYDAESRTLTIELPSALGSVFQQWSPLWRASLKYVGGDYIGSNAFGVRRKITRWAESDLIIAVHGSQWLVPDCREDTLGNDLSCPVEANGPTARTLSQNLRIIIVGRLTAPFISFESYTSDPTIDAPAEILHKIKYLHVDLEQLWLTDGANGRVLHKYSRPIGTRNTRAEEDSPPAPQSLGAVGISRGERQGVTITRLIPSGPAQRAGLKMRDVITAIDGKQVKETAEEAELLSSRPAGSSLRISYVRGAQEAEVQLVLGSDQQGIQQVVPSVTPPVRIRVSADVTSGLLIRRVDPNYPPLARQARISGTVVLKAVISKDGSIEELSLVSGHPMLAPAAIDAVKQWRYKPYYQDGRPVEVDTQVLVTFTLSGGGPTS